MYRCHLDLRLGPRFFQRMGIFPAESIAGSHVGLSFVVFPNFVVNWRPRLASHRFLFENVSLLVRFYFKKFVLLISVKPIGEYHQHFS